MKYHDIQISLQQIISSSIDAMMVCDKNGTIIMANEYAAKYIGYTVDEMIGNSVYKLNDTVYSNSTVIKALTEKKAISGVVVTSSSKNSLFLSTSVPVFDADGELSFVFTTSKSTDLMDTINRKLHDAQIPQEFTTCSPIVFSDSNNNKYAFFDANMCEILAFCNDISDYDGFVLINGESGSGKDVIAKYIHAHSERSSRPFIPINCSAIPRELFESEFFGYENGAFTGAKDQGRRGIFDIANNGTIFLDEIGDLPLEMQPKLLRVLESGEYTPIGSHEIKHTNARVIFATNKDLWKMKQQGTFREDLYYRIAVVPINIPPLRTRPADIRHLTYHFIDEANEMYKKDKSISENAIQTLLNYSWPGNIRELKNIIERAYILSPDNNIELTRENLTTPDFPSKDNDEITEPNFFSQFETMNLVDATSLFQKMLIKEHLRKKNVSETAKSLEIHRATIYRHIK